MRARVRHAKGLMLHKCEEVGAAKSPFAALADAKTGQRARVGPAAEGCFAHAEEIAGVVDIEQFVGVAHAAIPESVGKHPHRIFERIRMILERVQQLDARKLSRVVRTERHHWKVRNDQRFESQLQLDHFAR